MYTALTYNTLVHRSNDNYSYYTGGLYLKWGERYISLESKYKLLGFGTIYPN